MATASLSTTAALVSLGVETVKSRILIRKLGYLLYLLSDGAEGMNQGVQGKCITNKATPTKTTLMLDDPDSLCIVK